MVINRASNPYRTAIDIQAVNTRIFNNIFYSINGSKMGNKQVNITDDNLSMTNNLFFGQVDTRFKDYDEQAVFQNPNFYDESIDGAKGFQLLASSPAINAGIPYSGKYAHPPIPVGDSDIFSDIEAIPSVGFFGRSLTVNSTPNIGANNAKNGEITSLYNLENPLIRDLFNNQEIQFENVDNEFNYRLFDITGKEKKSGIINSSNSKIRLENNLENGVYSIIIENNHQKIFQKFIYRKSDS